MRFSRIREEVGADAGTSAYGVWLSRTLGERGLSRTVPTHVDVLCELLVAYNRENGWRLEASALKAWAASFDGTGDERVGAEDVERFARCAGGAWRGGSAAEPPISARDWVVAFTTGDDDADALVTQIRDGLRRRGRDVRRLESAFAAALTDEGKGAKTLPIAAARALLTRSWGGREDTRLVRVAGRALRGGAFCDRGSTAADPKAHRGGAVDCARLVAAVRRSFLAPVDGAVASTTGSRLLDAKLAAVGRVLEERRRDVVVATFRGADGEGDGRLTADEFLVALHRLDVFPLDEGLDALDAADVRGLYEFFDDDEGKGVDVDELLSLALDRAVAALEKALRWTGISSELAPLDLEELLDALRVEEPAGRSSAASAKKKAPPRSDYALSSTRARRPRGAAGLDSTSSSRTSTGAAGAVDVDGFDDALDDLEWLLADGPLLFDDERAAVLDCTAGADGLVDYETLYEWLLHYGQAPEEEETYAPETPYVRTPARFRDDDARASRASLGYDGDRRRPPPTALAGDAQMGDVARRLRAALKDLRLRYGGPVDLERAFERFDRRGRGVVESPDFLHVLHSLNLSAQDTRAISRRFDKYGDCVDYRDFIRFAEQDYNELTFLARHVADKLGDQQRRGLDVLLPFTMGDRAGHGLLPARDFADALAALDLDLTDADIGDLAAHFARPNDPDYVDYRDFLKFVREHGGHRPERPRVHRSVDGGDYDGLRGATPHAAAAATADAPGHGIRRERASRPALAQDDP
ncbi:hypothetical protein JL721_4912 [Aureococcus anophagefferens]|nr:hypothetical protein JL721_4912 [Aureococcus anophagefferens]